jgi:hypothetical protein
VGQLVRPDVGTVDGVPCTRPARTVIDLAAVVGRAALAVALDDALSRRLLTCTYLRQRIQVLGRQGRAGTATLVDLLDDRADGRPQSTSEFERRLFELLRSGGLPVPRPQFEVALPGGRTAFVDYAYPDVLLGIEADSFPPPRQPYRLEPGPNPQQPAHRRRMAHPPRHVGRRRDRAGRAVGPYRPKCAQ